MRFFIFLLTLILITFAVVTNVSAETYTFTKEGKTYIQTKTISGEKVIIETKIYDSSGNLLETKVTEKTLSATPVKQVVYPTKIVTPGVTKPLLPTPTPLVKVITPISETPVKTVLQTKYPSYVSSTSGKLVIKTESKEIELTKSPEEIVEKAKQKGMDIIIDVTLDESSDSVKYVVSGTKVEKFLAVFQVPLETKLIYDPDSGNLENKVQSGWTKVVDFFSI